MGSISMALLGCHADRTFVNVSGQGQLGNSNSSFSSVMDAPIMKVGKALVPQDAQLVSGQVIDAAEVRVQLYLLSCRRRAIMAAAWRRWRWNAVRISARSTWWFWWELWYTRILDMERVQVQISLIAKALVV